MKNVLFLGGGRRVSLAECFLNKGWDVYGYELNTQTPLENIVQVIPGLCWDDKNLGKHIQKVCQDYNINIILPLQDEAVQLLSTLNLSKGVVSNQQSAKICYDKVSFQNFMLKHFADIYPFYNNSKSPCIIKPRYGYGSNDIRICQFLEEKKLYFNLLYSGQYIVQEYKKGVEYTVDAYFNKQGRMVGAVPRIRLRVAGGEVVNSITEKNIQLINLTKSVGEKLQLRGPVCMQYIVNEEKRAFLFEINARFGGGSTLSMQAGFDMIDMLKQEYVLNKPLEKLYEWQNGLLMQRVFQDYFYRTTKP